MRFQIEIVSLPPGETELAMSGVDARSRGFDALECQELLRAHLEARGFLLCCQGARPNAVVSGMTRDMSCGIQCYIAVLGTPVREEDLVNVFDPAEPAHVGTLAQQREFRLKFYRSFRAPN